MLKFKLYSVLSLGAALIITAIPNEILAQNNTELTALNEILAGQTSQNNRLKRDVQPIPYWVDSSTLNLRDNPVAGKILGKLEYGQRILAYAQYENWVRISKSESKAKWVNSDFLSNSRLSWASYNQNRPTRSSDIIAVRIKDPENRKKRIFGVRLKTAETGNVLITTREDTALGPHFQNRFVSCDSQEVVGIRLIGEGDSFLGAQNDVRNLDYNIYESDAVETKPNNSTDRVISTFACKAQAF